MRKDDSVLPAPRVDLTDVSCCGESVRRSDIKSTVAACLSSASANIVTFGRLALKCRRSQTIGAAHNIVNLTVIGLRDSAPHTHRQWLL